MENEIDYDALFGVETGGEKEQEPAEPAEEPEKQGEKEQEPAKPDEGNEGEQDTENSEEPQESGGQSAEMNSQFAAARRKAEAERDAAVAKAKADAKAEIDRTVKEIYANSGLVNPYTKKPITTKEEFDDYRRRFGEERKKSFQHKSGMSDEEFQAFVQELPEVQEAEELRKAAEQAAAEARRAAADIKVAEQIKEISTIDPSIQKLEDLSKMPTYPAFYELVGKGLSLVEAFKLANYDALTKGAAEGGRQAALNSVQGKRHMTQTQQRGTGAIQVPADVMEQYRAINPGATDEEIRKDYAKRHKNDR